MRLSRTNFSNPFDAAGDEPADDAVDAPLASCLPPAPPLPQPAAPVAARPETPRPIYGARVEDNRNGENADEMAALEIEGRSDAPVWQSAFVLSPNVRFTRTPESAFAKKQPPVTDVPPLLPPAEATSIVEEAIAAATETGPHPSVHPVVMLEQAPFEEERGALALALRLRREFSTASSYQHEIAPPPAAPAHGPEIDLVCFPQDGAPETAEPVTVRTNDAFAFPVSDEVFWEAMLTQPDLVLLAPPVRWMPPEIASPVNSVTALYREIGVNPAGRTSRPLLAPPAETLQIAIAPPEVPQPAIAARPVVQEQAAPAAVPAPVRIRPKFALPHPSPAEAMASRETPKFAEAQMRPASAEYEFPPIDLLQEPRKQETAVITQEALEQSAGLLESVLEDFGIRGEIIDVRPGPVVTLYEFEPAPGVKSSRVIGLSDDIARSMSALSARVAVVPGRNVIGIELPNPVRETVYFRELIESDQYVETRFKLALCLGKTIGGEPVVAELAKMPHLLVAGTTGSGKSVAINTMILSLLYRLKPEECRLIMVDPKMLELSVYDGIPHLLTPVVTDPKKAVMALKWAVREMEDRYRKMSRLGVRNIDGYNTRAASARAKGETILCSVQTGFDRSSGEPVFEQEEMDLAPMPYIVVIVDEMADLMMVAGKEIEGAIQRLAQMARAAGIHLIMATQRPSVDVITGTIKANFPTRISFQVTSKIDSRTILGEQGAEHLLGQGDMLHMVGGGRIARVHGPFVSDEEVEKVVAHLKTQGRPEYLGTVTEDADEAPDEAAEEDGAVFDKGTMAEEDGNDLYDKAVKVVLRDKKCSTSYIQRRLSIGYNRAASLVERMEKEGLVGAANHVGKRSIIAGGREPVEMPRDDMEE